MARRECSYFDNELVEYFEEYDGAAAAAVAFERPIPAETLRSSVEALADEATTMLMAREDDSDFTWKDILIT